MYWISEEGCTSLLGREKALAFMRRFGGGRRLYIPKRPAVPHAIEEAVGVSGMAALCREYGGSVVTVASASNNIRRDYITNLLAQGLEMNEIACMAGVTVRTVQRIKKGMRAAGASWRVKPALGTR